MTVSTREIITYTIVPRFIPRLLSLMPDFRIMAYLIAVIFRNVGLLPQGHPFLRTESYGTYGIRTVMAAAAHNLRGGLQRIDQHVIYGVFVLGFVLLVLQFAVVFALIFISAAQAAIPFVGMFETVFPETDVAYLMLDKVFGIPGFFGSCYDSAVNAMYADSICEGYVASPDFPTPFHLALQALFRFYSFGMLMVAGVMVVYYIFVLIVETTATGVPFGKRFQSFYSPIRLVIAVLLMLPLAHGYNVGQYLTLHTAKWGSSFATNAWLLFNQAAGDNPLGLTTRELAGYPKIQEVSSLINFFYFASTCKAAYEVAYGKDIQPYFIRKAGPGETSDSVAMTASSDFSTTFDFLKKGDIVITFGEKKDEYTQSPGLVKPYCGEITLAIETKNVEGIVDIYEAYFTYIKNLWALEDLHDYGKRMACIARFSDKKEKCDPLPTTTIPWDAEDTQVAGSSFYVALRTEWQAIFNADMQAAIDAIRDGDIESLKMNDTILNYGWGGAGVWFNKIAHFNGSLVDASIATPNPTRLPAVMEFVEKTKKTLEPKTDPKDRFSPTTKSGDRNLTVTDFASGSGLDNPALDVELAGLMNTVYQDVANSETTSRPEQKTGESIIKNFVTMIFGNTALFDLRNNADVFPLARMAILGRSIIDKTIASIAAGALLTGAGGVLSGMDSPFGSTFSIVGSVFFDLAMTGLVVGFILYYLIPFFPFIYFFFAVGRWVKSIFEAMVAIPVWALAHLRLGGEGVPGQAASHGYFLLLEIMLRPILTLFGLVAALTIFAAMASVLDTIFDLVVYNVSGYDLTTLAGGGSDEFAGSAREALDELFYTVLYAIIIYMMALSAFKLIDLIPSKILRYAGYGGRTFGDRAPDPADNLVSYTAYGGYQVTEQMQSALGSSIGNTGRAVGIGIKDVKEMGKSRTSEMSERMRNNT